VAGGGLYRAAYTQYFITQTVTGWRWYDQEGNRIEYNDIGRIIHVTGNTIAESGTRANRLG